MRNKLFLTGCLIIVTTLVTLLAFAKHSQNLTDSGDDTKSNGAARNGMKGCANGACPTLGWQTSESRYSEVEQKLISHFCDRIAETGESQFEMEEVSRATGIPVNVLQGMALNELQPAVLNELKRRNVDLSSVSGKNCGNCSRFSACSVDRDLSGATGEELVRYEQEKAQDGMRFSKWQAPDFTLPSTDGEVVALSQFRGQPVVVTLLSGHCSHSFDTLPILTQLKGKYEPLGLTILPIYVNSGTIENILAWSAEMNLGYPLLVSADKKVSNSYGATMVPSTFLIDDEGHIKKKLVGYKNRAELDLAYQSLLTEDSDNM